MSSSTPDQDAAQIKALSTAFRLRKLAGEQLSGPEREQLSRWALNDSWALHHQDLANDFAISLKSAGRAHERRWRRYVCRWAERIDRLELSAPESTDSEGMGPFIYMAVRAGRLLRQGDAQARREYQVLRAQNPQLIAPWGALWSQQLLRPETLIFAGVRPPAPLEVRFTKVKLGSDDYARGGAGVEISLWDKGRRAAHCSAVWRPQKELDLHWVEVEHDYRRQGLGRWLLGACQALVPDEIETSGFTEEGEALWRSFLSD